MTCDRKKLYELQADVFQALGHPTRLAIIDLLKDGEMCVCDIASGVSAERSNVSRHLGMMVNAGVLSSRKDGLNVFYKLETRCVVGFLGCVADVVRARILADMAMLEDVGD